MLAHRSFAGSYPKQHWNQPLLQPLPPLLRCSVSVRLRLLLLLLLVAEHPLLAAALAQAAAKLAPQQGMNINTLHQTAVAGCHFGPCLWHLLPSPPAHNQPCLRASKADKTIQSSSSSKAGVSCCRLQAAATRVW
jgi:hypothetical protein